MGGGICGSPGMVGYGWGEDSLISLERKDVAVDDVRAAVGSGNKVAEGMGERETCNGDFGVSPSLLEGYDGRKGLKRKEPDVDAWEDVGSRQKGAEMGDDLCPSPGVLSRWGEDATERTSVVVDNASAVVGSRKKVAEGIGEREACNGDFGVNPSLREGCDGRKGLKRKDPYVDAREDVGSRQEVAEVGDDMRRSPGVLSGQGEDSSERKDVVVDNAMAVVGSRPKAAEVGAESYGSSGALSSPDGWSLIRSKECAAGIAPVPPEAVESFDRDENSVISETSTEDEDANAQVRAFWTVSKQSEETSTVTTVDGAPTGPMFKKCKRLPDLGIESVDVQVICEEVRTPEGSETVQQEAPRKWSYRGSQSCPALSMSVWMDRSSTPDCKTKDLHGVTVSGSQVDERDVPLYDRACVSALSHTDSEDVDCVDGSLCHEPQAASRCFNCGSYCHSLSSCPRPRDMAAIASARKMFRDKRGSLSRSREAARYYLSPSDGKFDNLRPGVLGPETRKALGIGELDPPPWLHRMRVLGYPPAYLEEPEDESSEVEIFGMDIVDIVDGKEKAEDGYAVEEMRPVVDRVSTAKRMIVEFPGINAPIPENGDWRLWAPPSKSVPEQLSRGTRMYYYGSSHLDTAPGTSPLSFNLSTNFMARGRLSTWPMHNSI